MSTSSPPFSHHLHLFGEDSKETKSNDEDSATATATATATAMHATSLKAAHAKEILDAWTRAGLSRYVDLPMICVLGDTSSGKSSVLSSLIGLELPSASTLTTKCPVLIQLQRASSPDDAHAVIDIQWHSYSTMTTMTTTTTTTANARNRNRNRTPGSKERGHSELDSLTVSLELESPRERKRTIEKHVESGATTEDSTNNDPNNENGSMTPSTPSTAPSKPAHDSVHAPPPPPPPPPSSSRPPPKWDTRTISLSTTPTWETDIPEIIQEAQQLILDHRETLVAPDVICVSLWTTYTAAAGMQPQQELTLVDLPGLVHFQHTLDQDILQQVEQVVLDYVTNPRSILLPVLAAPTHIHNSKVLQWARQVDPTTQRTIPVLTKPDLMDPGSESTVVELLTDHANSPHSSSSSPPSFVHGCYLVMNRGQSMVEAGTTLQKGLQLEADYFQTTLPWNALSVPQLGIPALRAKLANVLVQVVQDSWLDIYQELQDQMADVTSQLEHFGAGTGQMLHTKTDQRKFYHSLSQELVAQVATSLSGKGGNGTMGTVSSSSRRRRRRQISKADTTMNSSRHGRQRSAFSSSTMTTNSGSGSSSANSANGASVGGASQLHAACHEFFQDIQGGSLATINKLVEGASVLVSSPGNANDVKGEIVHIASTRLYACVDCIDDHDHTTDVLFDGVDFVTEQPDFEADEVWSDGTRVFVGRTGGHFDSLRKIPCSRIRTDPAWLEEKMARYRTDDLACFVNVDMFQQVIAEFVQDDWVPPCQKLLESLERILMGTLEEALHDQLDESTTRFPLLRQMVESSCHRVAQELLETAKTQIHEHLELEEQHPYTQDEVLMNAMNQSRFQSLRSDLDMQLRLDQEGVVYDTQAIQTILDTVFAKHQRSNWMAEQMELVLSCYGQVATQRVLDRTPQICWQTCRSLAKALQEELGCVTDDVLEPCLWESLESRQRFEDLTAQYKDLQQALDIVQTMR